MRALYQSAILAAGLFLTFAAHAQAPAVSATCKDGTAFSGSTRSGACRGHKGVASWNTAAAGGAAAAGGTAAAPGIAPAAAPATQATNTTQVPPQASIPQRQASNTTGVSNTATGKVGAPGQVWVNNTSKVYHCPGDRYYGKTKSGEFMSQSAAQAAGDHPAGGKACAS